MHKQRRNTQTVHITGRHHPLIKRIRAMVRSGLVLDDADILLETPTLIQDALTSPARIHTVLLRSDADISTRDYLKQLSPKTVCYEVEPRLFSSLMTTETSAGMLALARAPSWKQADLFDGKSPLILVLAVLADPGNLGTILRTAEAFGVTGVLMTKDTVSPFNAKAFRSAAGAALRLPMMLNCSAKEIIAILNREKIPLLVSTPRGGKPVRETNVIGPVALALGSEAAGLPRELAQAGVPVTIPMGGRIESLNVAIASAVLLYEITMARTAARATGRGNR